MSVVGQKLFDTFDVNKDGYVSLDELTKGFKVFDKNGQKATTPPCIKPTLREELLKVPNDDGSISKDEWENIYVESLGGSKEEALVMFTKLVKNEGGNLCSDSFKKIFDEMDNNKDGVVTRDEFESFWSKLCQ